MARFVSTRPLNIEFEGYTFKGPSGTEFEIEDALKEQFERYLASRSVFLRLYWSEPDEVASLEERVFTLENAEPGEASHPSLAAHDLLGLATQAELDAHTGGVDPHSQYATDDDLANHAVDTTSVHGIADTADLILEGDARLSDTRDPNEHAHLIADLPATVATDAEVTSAIATHAATPHGTDFGEVGDISSSAFSDSAAAGSTGEVADAGHRHAREADPVVAHVAAGDPHTGYRLESANHTHASSGAEGGQVSHANLSSVSADQHHAQSHVLATGTALGADHTIANAAAGEVLRALSATTAAFDVLQHGDLGSVTSDQHHNQAHALTGADHSHSGGAAGKFMRETGSTSFAFEAIPFSRGATVLKTDGIADAALNVIVWRAPFACTVTAVKGYRVGGSGATLNARRNGSSNHLSSAVSVGSADTWTDGGSVQNTAYAAGDKLEIMIVSASGAPTQLAVQVDFTRP